jgi:hypothetical protein
VASLAKHNHRLCATIQLKLGQTTLIERRTVDGKERKAGGEKTGYQASQPAKENAKEQDSLEAGKGCAGASGGAMRRVEGMRCLDRRCQQPNTQDEQRDCATCISHALRSALAEPEMAGPVFCELDER